jgi:ubiquinol-cytochrome c reductase iron-sulfur subunit
MTDVSDTRQLPRRDFIVQAAIAFVGVGCAAALWPFVDQMNPNTGTLPPERRDVDLASMEPGQTKTIEWRGLPVSIRHRTPDEVDRARNVALSELPDALARNAALAKNATASDANRTKAGHEQWLVVVSLCTHLGCRLGRRAATHRRPPRAGSAPATRRATTYPGASAAGRHAPTCQCRPTSSSRRRKSGSDRQRLEDGSRKMG